MYAVLFKYITSGKYDILHKIAVSLSCENAGYTESVVISVVCKSKTCLQIRQEIFQQYKTVITF